MMNTMKKSFCGPILAVFFTLALTTPLYAQQSIGAVTTVKKQVHVTHPGQDQVLLVKSGDGVLFQDTYETEAEARAKLLLADDSLLTLGEKTRLQITEDVYNPAQNRRSASMNLLSGRVRVLVGKIFTGAGSKFEIHTPTAVAAARGTYYIVWLFVQNGLPATGVAVLEGSVEVSNINGKVLGTVQLGPNQYTIVTGEAPPVNAAPIDPAVLADLLSSTDAPDELKEAIPDDVKQPEPDLLAGLETVPPLVAPPSVKEEAGIPGIPPILQQPANKTLVNVKISFP